MPVSVGSGVFGDSPVAGLGSIWIPTTNAVLKIDDRAGRRSDPPFFADASMIALSLWQEAH